MVAIAFLGLCFLGILFFGLLFAPDKVGAVGFKMREYRKETPGSIDLLLLGSSHIYSAFSPMQAWEETGVTSYVAAGPKESMNTTWATFRNCLATQTPKVAMVELRGISFADKATADVREGPVTGWYERLEAAMSGRKITTWPTVFFDFFTYHSRWKSLAYEDYVATAQVLTGQVEPAFLKGYVHLTEANPQTRRTDWEPYGIEQDKLDANLPYLDAIVELAEVHNVKLVFLMTPAAYVRYFDNYLAVVQARYPDIPLLNLNAHVDDMALDMNRDMFDSGHMNAAGALKCTREILSLLAVYELPDHRGDASYLGWDRDLKKYGEFLASQ